MADAIVRVNENRAVVSIAGIEALSPLVAVATAAQAGSEAARDTAISTSAGVSSAMLDLVNLRASGRHQSVSKFQLSGFLAASRTRECVLLSGSPSVPPVAPDPTAPMIPKDILVGIGHSMVEQGIAASIATALADPSRLGVALPTANLGVSGATARAIALGVGAQALAYRPIDGVIPASVTRVVLTPADNGPAEIYADGDASRWGVLAGVAGKIDWQSSTGTVGFTREHVGRAVSVPIATPFIQLQYDRDVLFQNENVSSAVRRKVVEYYRDGFAVFWFYRNSIDENISVTSQQREAVQISEALVARLRPQKKGFVILSELNSDIEPSGSAGYKRVLAVNAALAARWPREFIDVRTPLVASYNTGNATDIANHSSDIPPSTKRSDFLHLNSAGRTFVAGVVADAIMSRKLLSDTQ